ncbi:MAG: serine/threonine protein kinase, partial [Ignavibacteria bacterium]|nr:serine/threonine protein kinase [Ignavibacteria bacterium]
MIGIVILNYKVISLIGEGGMGSVYLAEHQTLGRKAAIKVLLPELARNQMIRDRFINEARTLSLLNHQN